MKSEEVSSYFQKWQPLLKNWNLLCNDLNCSPLELAINFVCNLDCIDFAVIGVQNNLQLKQITSSINPYQKINMDYLSSNDPKLIDPTNWKLG